MENNLTNKVLSRMYRERGNKLEASITKMLEENEKDLYSNIELKLKDKFENSKELCDILDDISILCSVNCETYYKMGVADGINLEREIQIFNS